MLKKVFLVVTIIVLAALGVDVFQEYMANHLYYNEMWASTQNRKIVGAGIIFALLPTRYILGVKKGGFWGFLGSVFVALVAFMGTYLTIKGGLQGGLMKMIFNVAMLFGLGVGMCVTFTVLGGYIKERWLGMQTTSVFGVVINLGLGLCAFILGNHILIMLNLFYPIVTRLILAGAAFMIWRFQDTLTKYWHLVQQSYAPRQRNKIMILCMGVLLVLAGVYFFNGFTLAFIPYSTAWDANHAYMFHPKMRALNNGYYWDVPDMLVPPQVWYSFIAYWFSLFSPFTSFLGLSADTYAIEMNFWSGIFVLIFGWAAISEVIAYVSVFNEKKGDTQSTNTDLIFFVGALLLLLWLTSGMGAFLVFIDNKTDLGIFALILLAIYSGFYFLRLLLDRNEETQKHIMTYIMLSGFFYAMAVLAKPTALFDVANFGLFLWGAWFGLIGVVGMFLVIIGLMGAIQFRGANEYLTAMLGTAIGGVGAGATILDILLVIWKRTWTMTRYLVLWVGSFLVVFLVIKLPIQIGLEMLDSEPFNVRGFAEKLLFTAAPSSEQPSKSEKEIEKNDIQENGLAAHLRIPLYAQVSGTVGVNNCTLESQGFTTREDLYKGLQERRGSGFSEDVGRYVGYGWKGGTTDQRRGLSPFVDPWWGFLFKDGCHTFSLTPWDKTGKLLCENETKWRSNNATQLQEVQQLLPTDGKAYELVGKLIDLSSQGVSGTVQSQQSDSMTTLEALMQNESVKVVDDGGKKIIYFPYKYLNIFNITFNRSLQNLSSYYTDIGVVRLLLIFTTLIGLVYGLIRGKRLLSVVSLVTLCGWLLRWMIGGGILWYGIGIIAWTIIAFVIYLMYLLGDEDDTNKALSTILLVVLGIICAYQMSLNLVRIASQGGGGAFLWYKSNAGVREEYDEQLRRTTKRVTNYSANDVFNLQFPQYNKIIKLANERGENEGLLIAGTYLRYFVNKQHYIMGDGFMEWMAKMFSDSNTCNSYLRLKDKNLRYLVIDPNIGTVVQGGGNQTLFDRFFARINPSDGSLLEHGAISMLVKLQQEGYLRYVSSNNLGAKYAFILPDSQFGNGTPDQITVAKARMAIARFWGQDNAFVKSAIMIAEDRVKSGEFVEDLADLMGKEIRADHLKTLVKQAGIKAADIKDLTQDERIVLGQFLTLVQMAQQNPEQFHQQMVNLMNSSIGAGSQLIVLELL